MRADACSRGIFGKDCCNAFGRTAFEDACLGFMVMDDDESSHIRYAYPLISSSNSP